ncbi:HD domain-containing protein [Lachnospiraceae bacterium OttesenSCG-928-D06]|nr:HD domain-containing protein [Lachnospiraceae bacterium OttesenSCG-928-D06]
MNGKKKVVLVDENVTSLMICKEVLGSRFDVLTVPTREKLMQLLLKVVPDLILLNNKRVDRSCMGILECLKSDKYMKTIPILFLVARDDFEGQKEGIRLGASDFILKPYEPSVLIQTIERQFLFAAKKKEIKRYEEAAGKFEMEGLFTSRSVKELIALDQESAADLRCYLEVMIKEMRRRGIYSKELLLWNNDGFIDSARLHDVGNLVVRDEILKKPGRLTRTEFEAVKSHTMLGVKVIEEIEGDLKKEEFYDNAKLFAASHHERWDGSGYPLGLKEREIPIQGRIMAIIDVYHALVSKRPYKKALSHEEARGIIVKSRGILFDPLLVDIFLSVSDEFKEIQNAFE